MMNFLVTVLFAAVVVSGCWLVAVGLMWALDKAKIYRASKRETLTRQDLLEQIIEIDAEILDLFDERADIVQALRKAMHTGRA